MRKGRVSLIVVKSGKVALIHRFRDGEEYWVLPGGGIEGDETPEQAGKRELKEELDFDIVSMKLVHEGKYNDNSHTSYIFDCEIVQPFGPLQNPESSLSTETDQHIPEWVEIERVASLVVYPEVIKKILL